MNKLKIVLIGIIIIGIFGVTGGAICKSYEKSLEIDSLKLELNKVNKANIFKQNTKDSLIIAVDDYINKIAPKNNISSEAIIDACAEYNIDIKFVLAQGQLESGFGTKGIALKTNSVWNVMSYDGWSAEYIKNKGYGYSHPNESIIPYIKLLKSKYLVNGKTENDLMNKFVSNSGYRYASNPKYESQLKYIYNKISKTNIDRLFNNYIKLI